MALYKATVALVRAYANLSDEMDRAGYGEQDVIRIKGTLKHYVNARDIVRRASGESLDLKAYEADMRHLLDTYVEADEPRKISPFDDETGLLDSIVKSGIGEAVAAQLGGLKGNKDAIAETIENNVRRKIIKEHLNDPGFYEKMSALLDEIIATRKAIAIEYEKLLQRYAELIRQLAAGHGADLPAQLNTPGRRALYNNLPKTMLSGKQPRAASASGAAGDDVLDLALKIDYTVKAVRHDGWRGVQAREQVIKQALFGILQDVEEVERIFLIINAQKEY